MRRIMLLVTVAAVMTFALAVGAATAATNNCGYEGSVWTCMGGYASGGSFDADGDGTPDGGGGGGCGGRLSYDTTNDNVLTESRGCGGGGSDADVVGQPSGGFGQHCTGTLHEAECVGGSSPSRSY